MGKDSTRDELIDELGEIVNKYSTLKMTLTEIVGVLEFVKICIIDKTTNGANKE